MKVSELKSILRTILTEVKRANPTLFEWVHQRNPLIKKKQLGNYTGKYQFDSPKNIKNQYTVTFKDGKIVDVQSRVPRNYDLNEINSVWATGNVSLLNAIIMGILDADSDYHKKNENMEGTPGEDLINGQSNNIAASRVNKIIGELSKGIFSDNSWEVINKIFDRLREAGLDVHIKSTKYGGHGDTSNGMPKYKEWQISIPFTNKNGKPVELVGQITAHGAGSIANPLDRYDVTGYVTPVAVKSR